MCFLTLEDLTARVEVVVFPRAYARFRRLLVPDAVILVNGTVHNNNGEGNKVIGDYLSSITQGAEGDLIAPF
jgi:DNA polymerase-3 subunit alpha